MSHRAQKRSHPDSGTSSRKCRVRCYFCEALRRQDLGSADPITGAFACKYCASEKCKDCQFAFIFDNTARCCCRAWANLCQTCCKNCNPDESDKDESDKYEPDKDEPDKDEPDKDEPRAARPSDSDARGAALEIVRRSGLFNMFDFNSVRAAAAEKLRGWGFDDEARRLLDEPFMEAFKKYTDGYDSTTIDDDKPSSVVSRVLAALDQ